MMPEIVILDGYTWFTMTCSLSLYKSWRTLPTHEAHLNMHYLTPNQLTVSHLNYRNGKVLENILIFRGERSQRADNLNSRNRTQSNRLCLILILSHLVYPSYKWHYEDDSAQVRWNCMPRQPAYKKWCRRRPAKTAAKVSRRSGGGMGGLEVGAMRRRYKEIAIALRDSEL
jgi:hypothetical protein